MKSEHKDNLIITHFIELIVLQEKHQLLIHLSLSSISFYCRSKIGLIYTQQQRVVLYIPTTIVIPYHIPYTIYRRLDSLNRDLVSVFFVFFFIIIQSRLNYVDCT